VAGRELFERQALGLVAVEPGEGLALRPVPERERPEEGGVDRIALHRAVLVAVPVPQGLPRRHRAEVRDQAGRPGPVGRRPVQQPVVVDERLPDLDRHRLHQLGADPFVERLVRGRERGAAAEAAEVPVAAREHRHTALGLAHRGQGDPAGDGRGAVLVDRDPVLVGRDLGVVTGVLDHERGDDQFVGHEVPLEERPEAAADLVVDGLLVAGVPAEDAGVVPLADARGVALVHPAHLLEGGGVGEVDEHVPVAAEPALEVRVDEGRSGPTHGDESRPAGR